MTKDFNQRLIVKFKENKKKSDIVELSDAEDDGDIPQLGVKLLKIKNPKAIAAILKNNKNIEYIEEDSTIEPFIIPNDTNWNHHSLSFNVAGITAGWDTSKTTCLPIAYLDSGLYIDHPDLNKPVLGTYVGSTVLDPYIDPLGHGTNSYGINNMVSNNSYGGCGICWDNCRSIVIRMPLTVDNKFNTADCAAAVTKAADLGAKILNCPWGSSTDGTTMRNAVNYAFNKGCVIIAGSGNTGEAYVVYPAGYTNVLAIGGTPNGTTRAAASNYGPNLDLIHLSSARTTTNAGSFSSVSGTSFSCGQTSGVVALVWEMLPHYTNAQIIQFMRDNAKPMTANIGIGGGWHEETGYGLAHLETYMKKIKEITG